MLALKKQIPNLLTLSNLLCGMFIIISSFYKHFDWVVYFAVASLVFDFLDGTAARVLKVSSDIGKELDSMADMVSFGVAPALVLFNFWNPEGSNYGNPLYYSVLVLAAFAGYRLAKFNISDQDSDYFSGLPTPALALASFAIPLAARQSDLINETLTSPVFILLYCLIGGVLMVSNVKLFSLKLGSANKQLNRVRIIFLICCLVLIAWQHFLGAILCLVLYLSFSLAFQKQIGK